MALFSGIVFAKNPVLLSSLPKAFLVSFGWSLYASCRHLKRSTTAFLQKPRRQSESCSGEKVAGRRVKGEKIARRRAVKKM